jgi:ubiquinone/menaquinone biosynthesis C-methylase UbiE
MTFSVAKKHQSTLATMQRKQIVESGYNRIFDHYNKYRRISANKHELDNFVKHLPKQSTILDMGCGSGLVAKFLMDRGIKVIGIDVSRNMVNLARKSAPAAKFYKIDMTRMRFADNEFDGVVALYSIIHVPRTHHARIFKEINRITKSDGIVLLSVGGSDLENYIDDNWMNWGSKMYWSHFDKNTNLGLVKKAGFEIISCRLSGEEGDKHPFILARRLNV